MLRTHVSIGARVTEKLRLLVWLYVALVAIGLGTTVISSDAVQVDGWPAQVSTSPVKNLAHLSSGVTLGASSFDAADAMIHPLYAIDGDPSPRLRWAAAPKDRRPWLRVKLHKRSDIESIALLQPPRNRNAKTNCVVRCRRVDGTQFVEIVTRKSPAGEWDGRPMAFRCVGADEVLIDFDLSAANLRAKLELSEVTIMGHEP